MKKQTKNLCLAVLGLLAMQPILAQDIKITGSKSYEFSVNPENTAASAKEVKINKEIQLLQVHLSDAEKDRLAQLAQNALSQQNQFMPQSSSLMASPYPSTVQLGMNKVPVLDQGIHGTCVTFALTGVLDAVLGKGDYISQLCNLELGSYFENMKNGTSGWEGAHATSVIKQMTKYGVVNKKSEHTIGCGGMKSYPVNKKVNRKAYIDPEHFTMMSEPVIDNVANWSDVYVNYDPEATLNNVKQAINSGSRVVFAFLLPRYDLGVVGAVGTYKNSSHPDTWVLTKKIIKGVDSVEAAHEVIITGYDDGAKAKDSNGKKHHGLLKIRNSWGKSVGHKGEFFMSYDYFKLLAYDAQQFKSVGY